MKHNNLKKHEGLMCENCKVGKFHYDEESKMLICDCCYAEIK